MHTYLQSLKERDVIRVEMVCLGNICRSPMAAAVLEANAYQEVLAMVERAVTGLRKEL